MKIDLLAAARKNLAKTDSVRAYGTVQKVIGLVIESAGPQVSLGEMAKIHLSKGGRTIFAEAVGFRDNRVLFMPLGVADGIALGDRIEALKTRAEVPVSGEILGRVVNPLGIPMDDKGSFRAEERYPIHRDASNPMHRRNLREALSTGVRTIDALLTCAKGQRVGIFSGSGIGKSTLLGMIARYTSADVNVLGLIGERGREVREFIEKDLGPEGMARSVVVASTSDMPPLQRIKVAFTASAIAEYFADQGHDVLLLMDSVTRFAMAQREVGLSIGEPPSSKGYTPSVFSQLPHIYERAGSFENKGSITGFYTILVEGDDMADPIADHSRAILDGHIILSRDLASRNFYPAIDVLNSISRLMNDIGTKEHIEAAGKFRDLLSTYFKAEDMVNIGAYKQGANPKIDLALAKIDDFTAFLRQPVEEPSTMEEAISRLQRIALS
jgi:flagellum-specific ATP synthase